MPHRLTLAALVLFASVGAASAYQFVWPPSDWPAPGSFDGPGIVTQDDAGK